MSYVLRRRKGPFPTKRIPNKKANEVALAVSGAIFLILELDQPFGGLIGISSEPMLKALSQIGK